MRALMVAPLLTSERAIGVLEVGSEQAGVYTRGEMRTLQSLASTLAVNARSCVAKRGLRASTHS